MKTTDVHFPRQVIRNLWNRDPINCFFDPTVSCVFCILQTQFHSSPFQLSDEKCYKIQHETWTQESTIFCRRSKAYVKERSPPAVMLRGKSYPQGHQCQCCIKQYKFSEVQLLQKDFSNICPTLLPNMETRRIFFFPFFFKKIMQWKQKQEQNQDQTAL